MDIEKAYRLAREKMNDYNLYNWDVIFDNAKSRFGCCWNRQKLITLSKVLVELNEEADVLDTILHEIAHALTPSHGHDKVWKQKALEIGCDGKRCYERNIVQLPKTNYIAVCDRCKFEFKRHKRVNQYLNYYCTPCLRQGQRTRLNFVKEVFSQNNL